jgi:hypothetical protein
MFGFGRKRRGRLNDKGKDMGDEQDEFKRKIEALEAVGSVVERVQDMPIFFHLYRVSSNRTSSGSGYSLMPQSTLKWPLERKHH